MSSLVQNPTIISAAEAAVIRMSQDGDASIAAMTAATISTFRQLWHGGQTAEMLAVMGTKAGPAFQRHAAAVQFLLSIGVALDPADYTPPQAFTVHADGTITLD